MRRPFSALLDELVAEGLAPATAPHDARTALAGARLAAEERDTPWYARVAAGFGAWVATLLVLGFLAAAGLDPGEPAAIPVGLALVGGAVALRRAARAEFARQAALATSFAGQGLVLVAVADELRAPLAAGLVAVLLSAALVVAVPDAAHRFMSAVVGAVGLMTVATELRLGWTPDAPLAGLAVRGGDVAALLLVGAAAWAWRAGARARDTALDALLEPVAWGLTVAVLGLLVVDATLGPTIAWTAGGRAASHWRLGAPTTIALAVAGGLLARAVLAEQRADARAGDDGGDDATGGWGILAAALAGLAALALLTLPTPGILAAAVVLALGFDRRRPLLVGLGALFLVVFLGFHYHALRLTLLEKAGALGAAGLLLLAASWRLGRGGARRQSGGPRASDAAVGS